VPARREPDLAAQPARDAGRAVGELREAPPPHGIVEGEAARIAPRVLANHRGSRA
jgi:hypothetical protein